MVAAGAALGPTTYVCVMKSKQAELDALEHTPTDTFLPLLEVTGADKAAAIIRRYQPGPAVWIQPVNITGIDDDAWADDTTALFSDLRDAGVSAVPVAVLDETAESAAALDQIQQTDGHGLVLRLDAEELVVVPPATVRADVDAFLSRYGLDAASCDLVLDASLVRDSVAARVATVESAMGALPYLKDWRNVVVAMSAFPPDLGAQMGKDSVHGFDRADRAAFLSLLARGPARDILYADFAVGQPTYADVPFSPIPNIKYTDVAEWQVHRANSRTNPSPQYEQLAEDVSRESYFRGPGFSRGDTYIADVASGADGPGNATTYLRAAMSHHLAHVLDRFSTHGEP